MSRLLTRLILPLLLLSLVACSPKGEIGVIDAWARPANQGDNSAVYFKVNNPGPNTDSLIEASSEVAAQTELHKSEMDSQGVMSMHHQSQIDIPPDSQLEFAPGGLHVMLIDLQQDLKVGDTIKITLGFKNYGELTLDVPVQQP